VPPTMATVFTSACVFVRRAARAKAELIEAS
jgi:hypothetical protein